MTITKTKIQLNFKNEYDENEYYHGKDSPNPNLKYLTPSKLTEIIKIINIFDKEIIKIPLDGFEYANDLKGVITKNDIENPTEEAIPVYLNFISAIFAYDTYPSDGLSVNLLPDITPILTKDELIELLNHIAYPYRQYGEYWIGITNLEIVETDFGNYFRWEVTYGDDDFENNGTIPFTTINNTTDFTKFETVKELKDFLNTIPEDNKLPILIYDYYEE